MDTRFLESLMVVAERGSIAAAARELHVTPAAIAQRVQALETEIGVKLLVRSGRTVVPTAAGSAVLGQARGIVRDIRALRTTALGGEIAGELRLGAIGTAMTGLLPDLLKRCSLEFPRIDVHVSPGTSRELYPRVLDGALDAALIVEPDFVIPKVCDWRLLREEPLIAISPKGVDGDLAHMLSACPFIRYDRSNWGGRLADLYLRRNGIRPRERFELDSLDAIAVLVDRGLGVSLVPDWAPPWPSGLSLKKRPIVDAGYARRLGMLSLRASAQSHLVTAFLG